MSREIVEKFNRQYGDLFPMPEPLIDEGTGVIPGLDGRKMSKSYNNYIGLFEDPKKIRKKVMKIVTDSREMEEPKDPYSCNVFALYRYFATAEEEAELCERYMAGGMGYGHAKQELFEVMNRELTPLRENYESWRSRPDDIRDVLKQGAKRARELAAKTLSEVREAVGVRGRL
jgi:tryptophanyl-tRNA synthetase